MSDRASILLVTALLVGGVVEVVGLKRRLRALERAAPAARAEPARPTRHLHLVTTS